MNRRGVPDDGIFGPEIAMGQDVAEAGNGAPGDVRRLPCHFLRKMFHCFSDDFEVADYCVNRAPVADECLIVETLDVGLNGEGGFEDVLKAELRITRHEAGQVGCVA